MIEPPLAGTEAETLVGSLERQRATLRWKCSGVDADGMRATIGASALTLGGLLKHLALVEDDSFSVRLGGSGRMPPFDAVDWASDPDWEWRTAAEDTPEELLALWDGAVARSRAALAEAVEAGGLDQVLVHTDPPHPSLRRVVADLVEEYARHVGHADLIREAVDGLTGEDPPEEQ